MGSRRLDTAENYCVQSAALEGPKKDNVIRNFSPGTQSADAAERRQVTVMFSDLWAQRRFRRAWTPKTLREVISAYQRCVAETVGVRRLRCEVHGRRRVDLLWLSASPRGRRRASGARRAGIGGGMSAHLKTHCATPNARRHRDWAGGCRRSDRLGEAQERGIVGETPNLAARLQGIAEPNSV